MAADGRRPKAIGPCQGRQLAYQSLEKGSLRRAPLGPTRAMASWRGPGGEILGDRRGLAAPPPNDRRLGHLHRSLMAARNWMRGRLLSCLGTTGWSIFSNLARRLWARLVVDAPRRYVGQNLPVFEWWVRGIGLLFRRQAQRPLLHQVICALVGVEAWHSSRTWLTTLSITVVGN